VSIDEREGRPRKPGVVSLYAQRDWPPVLVSVSACRTETTRSCERCRIICV
jgi:hypothetical protein